MRTILIPAKYKKEIILEKEILDKLKNAEKIAVFHSLQFSELSKAKEQLKHKKLIAVKAIRGCDVYPDEYEREIMKDADAILYVGDGLFHPKALLFAQIGQKKIKPVLTWNPMSGKAGMVGDEEISRQIKKMRANLLMYMNAQTVGIIVTTKPGQQKISEAEKLKQKLESEGRKTYIFIADTIDLAHFENYPFVESWVNTACPRIGMDDVTNIEEPLINIKEAFEPEKAIEKLV